MLNKLQAQEPSSYWHAGGRPSMQSLEQGGPTASQMRAYLSDELERHQVLDGVRKVTTKIPCYC